MIILETERLNLSLVFTAEAPFIIELLNSPTWIKWIGDRHVHTLQEAELYIKTRMIASYKTFGYGMYKISLKSTGEALGLAGLVNRDALDHPDIGFALLPKFEGLGIAYEASKAVLDHALGPLEMETLWAITEHKNIRSQALLERLGMTSKGNIYMADDDEELMLFTISKKQE